MSLENTVLNLIDVLNDIVETGFLRGDDMEEYVQDCILQAKRDLAYRVQPDDGYDAFGVNTQNSFNTPPK